MRTCLIAHRKYNRIGLEIQVEKTTCLWLKGLPNLEPTDMVEPELVSYKCANGKVATFSKDYGGGGGTNGKRRSKTYPGVARAMAEQWTL